ncbi:MAG: class I SAM-dependent methyltransferase [Candidatus Omnitrophica bacterium]|nr:class I SAM-dependent methyltransferase [Candidatus Omnitrophota bacterium]
MSSKARLILVSFLGLFLELSFIRWIPAHVFSIAFFANIILIASFLGLGLGLLLSEKKQDLFRLFPLTLVSGMLIVVFLKNIQVDIPDDAQTWIWSYYKANRLYLPKWKMPVVHVLQIVFIVTSVVFIPVGQMIGRLMKEFKPLHGYTLNIFGSLLGVVCFGIISFFNAPAYIWFLISAIIVALIFYRKRGFVISLVIMSCAISIVGFSEKDMLWSPYYSIELSKTEEGSLSVYVNQFFHQRAVNFNKDELAREKFSFPYRWFNAERVLIIGAGTGNDVWAAQRSGARYIDAVEIDPVILKLGNQHPQRPYDNSNVRVFMDDARSFMHKASGPYDMIVYGTLDSHATLSMSSSIRLDNYVYTREALKEARGLLSKEGVIVLLFSVPTEWMKERLLSLVRSVFEEDETRYVITDPYLFNLIVFAGPGLERSMSRYPEFTKILSKAPEKIYTETLTDDWPYLYLEKRGIPRLYLITIIALICTSLAGIFMLSPLKLGKINIFFLLFGCGFLLLETKSVTTLSLLFGSTWFVNAVVFSGILSLALAANWLVMIKGLKRTGWFFACLFLSLIMSYFFPLAELLRLNFFIKILAAGCLAGLPIFFAAIIFAIVFSKTRLAGIALGSNLLGAVIGGFLEYTSMAFGLSALYIVALACYTTAAIYLVKSRSRY